MKDTHLKITEIFYSLQGESRTVGFPTAFIRLTGCPLRCNYCDTSYAFHGGTKMTITEILISVEKFRPRFVTVTGGEPLAQPHCHHLLTALCDREFEVSLETSGAIDVSKVDPRVIKVMDIKTPGSNEQHRNEFENIEFMTRKDQIKFVICDREDYEWSKGILRDYDLLERCEILFSPAHEQLRNDDLADWIIKDNLKVRFQIQLHKYIWGNFPGK